MTVSIHQSITEERVISAVQADDNIGFCTGCGQDAYSVEPDARGHKCDNCGEMAVYGAEEFLIHLIA